MSQHGVIKLSPKVINKVINPQFINPANPGDKWSRCPESVSAIWPELTAVSES